jgi:hypothetical protein
MKGQVEDLNLEATNNERMNIAVGELFDVIKETARGGIQSKT